MIDNKIILITGTRKGIGRFLSQYYCDKGDFVIGCSRDNSDFTHENYQHFCLDISDEEKVLELFSVIRKKYGRLDVLINNAGIASMNHFLLTPIGTVNRILQTNLLGTFLFCREAGKIMLSNKYGRIVNFTTIAAPLHLEGEAIYAASKAAIENLTKTLSRELGYYKITINAIGATPIKTDLIKSVPEEKMTSLLQRQAIQRYGEFKDITNVIDFFIRPESDFITGQIIYLGGV